MGFNSSGVLIGLAFDGRPISPRWAVYMQMQDAGTNLSKTICPVEGLEVGLARQHMAESAVATTHDFGGRVTCTFCKTPKTETNTEEYCSSRTPFMYVWFVDDDVIVPPQTLLELIDKLTQIRASEALEHGEPKTVAIGGIYCTKSDTNPTPVAYRKISGGPSWDWKCGDIFNVEGIGTGCLLIHTDIFSKIDKPWFRTVNEEISDDEGRLGRAFITDDLFFCQKVLKAGYNIVAHGGILCAHYDYKTRKYYGLPKDSPPYVAAREAEAASLHCAVPPEGPGNTSAPA